VYRAQVVGGSMNDGWRRGAKARSLDATRGRAASDGTAIAERTSDAVRSLVLGGFFRNDEILAD